MAKAVIKLQETSTDSKSYSLDKIKKALIDNNACYVLITCGSPSDDGKMNVEMSYEGDDVLAAYLVDNAQQIFDERSKKTKSR
jgi:hypothetical protein